MEKHCPVELDVLFLSNCLTDVASLLLLLLLLAFIGSK